MERIEIKRKVFGKKSFSNVVNTTFNQLVPKDDDLNVDQNTVDNFFDMYNELFLLIPERGEKSHLEIINRSSEYIGISLLDLEEEIAILRQENVSLKNQLINLNQ